MKISNEQYTKNCKPCAHVYVARQEDDGWSVKCEESAFLGDACGNFVSWQDDLKRNGLDKFGVPKSDIPVPENVAVTPKPEPRPIRVMISQPMKDLSEQKIKADRAEIRKWLGEQGYDVELLNTYFEDYPSHGPLKGNIPLYYLAQSLNHMAWCDAVVFASGWENARGCRIEHEVAVAYGLFVMEYKGDMSRNESE
jgi:hypothetical protein